MKLSTLDLQLESLDALQGIDTLLLFIGEDERPLQGLAGLADWRLCGGLSRVLLESFFAGARGDCVLLSPDGRLPIERIIALGLGKLKELNPATAGEVLLGGAGRLNKARVEGVALEVPGAGVLDEEARVRALNGVFLPEFKGDRVALLADRLLARALPK